MDSFPGTSGMFRSATSIHEVKKMLCTSDTLYHALEDYDLLNIYEAFKDQPGRSFNKEDLRRILSYNIGIIFEDIEYDFIYKKIDIHSSGLVTWDDFISFLILGYEQAAISTEYRSLEPPIPVKAVLLNSKHRSYVIRVIFYPTLTPDRSMSWYDGSYLTASKDGRINYWSLDLTFEKTVVSKSPDLRITSTWVTDIAVLPDVSILCTSSSERDLRFYDISAGKFHLRVRFTSFKFAIMTLSYYYPKFVEQESILVMGDMIGHVIVLYIETRERGPFQSLLGMPLFQCRFDDVRNGIVAGFRVKILAHLHDDSVRQVYYYKSIHSVVSCCSGPSNNFAVTDITDDKNVKQDKAYKIPAGVWCFDVVETVHMIATGGPDGLVRVWNPFMVSRPTATFYRHHSGIVCITFQDEGKLLYSLSKDKNIKVWDMTSQTLIQNYIDLPPLLGEQSMTTLYNPETRQWIIASVKLATIPLSPKQSSEHTDGSTHSSGVSQVLYNKLFKVIVTVGIDSYILVWNPWDGRNMMIIKDAHVRMLHGLPIPVEITSASFSENYHFLVTAAHDGSMKIWDFHNGTCLRNFRLDSSSEICDVFWVGLRILSTGWNKMIVEFNSKGESVGESGGFSKYWEKRHVEEISSAAIRVPQTIVTASFNGDIVMWKLETGQAYKKYNVSNPTVRLKIKYKMPKKTSMHESVVAPTSVVATANRRASRRKSALPEKKSLNLLLSQVPMVVGQRRISHVGMPGAEFLRKVAVHSMIFLLKREMHPNVGTLLVSLENGVIQVWSHDVRGAFITSFSAIHKAGDYALSMTTDENNEFLFTGHSVGYIKTWLIKDFCVLNPERISLPKYKLKFPYLWSNIIRGRCRRVYDFMDKPVLLNCYKAHFLPISSLAYIDECEILISGSADRSARLWTLDGKFMQTLGSFKAWKTIPQGRPVKNDEFEFTVPADLKRLLSSTSLRVLSGGTLARKMTQKQVNRRALKQRVGVNPSKAFGKPLTEPYLGHYYKFPERKVTTREIVFDTSLSNIPIYQHLGMDQPVEVTSPPYALTLETKEVKGSLYHERDHEHTDN